METAVGVAAGPAAANPQRPAEPQFPDVTWIKGRGYIPDSALSLYQAQLVAFALGVAPVRPPRTDPDRLVPLKVAAARLGVGRRTVGRRIAESTAARRERIAAATAAKELTSAE
jgi:hypothetical protein